MKEEALVTDDPAMTFEEVSMERSKSFVKALQELKNLRPQLYSAADYCEKSYLHSEQKQMVLDNLKDYTVKALVNAVDHLGTVASKLTDLFDHQSSDISTMQLRASCVSQQLLTSRTYIDKEGLRQQQLLAVIPVHHKHYTLPNSVNKRVHFSPLRRTDTRQNHYQVDISRLQPSGSETKSTLKGTTTVASSSKDSKAFVKTSGVFHLSGDEENIINKKPFVGGSQVSGVPATSTITRQTYGVAHKAVEVPKLTTAHKSHDNPRGEIIQAPVRTKSVMSAFFVKPKTPKLKAGYVS
ncbi:PREDICTED: protein ABIL1-like isoform X2 [Brassica oleracea var. oleracea]|uniref:protein ABIL1-like isoform X2 n=1 Tax=Brassica oleracea var. oleracea TaxID=109376 RepID=UPI0006A6D276|nr:PREDICTED: protein ABIL1-like isoform X2 [Brassica oleracea var. oleracea]